MESRLMTLQEALAMVSGAHNVTGKKAVLSGGTQRDMAQLASDFKILLADKNTVSLQQDQKASEFTQGIKYSLMPEEPIFAVEHVLGLRKIGPEKLANELTENETVSVKQLLSDLSGLAIAAEEDLSITEDKIPNALSAITVAGSSTCSTEATNVATASTETVRNEVTSTLVEKLVTQQAQRLMVNTPKSVFDSATDVAIQLKDQVLPGTTLNIKQAIDGVWQVTTQCQSSEIAELLRRAMPQLQSRFKSKDLGEIRLFEPLDVDRSDKR